MSHTDVLVCGAGPTGLLAALGLARAGVDVTVIDQAPEVARSPRAMTYVWYVLDGLEELGVLDDLESEGLIARDGLTMRVFATGEQINWSLDVLAGAVKRPYNVLLGQDRLTDLVLRHLHRLPNVRVRWNAALESLTQDDDGATATVQTPDGASDVRAGWIIGADGANSAVRRAVVGSTFDGTTWPERFVATNIRYSFEKHGFGNANMLIDPVHGAVIALIDSTGLWRVTYSEDADLPDATVRDRMADYFDVVLPGSKQYELVHYSAYRMHQRSAPSMRMGRVLLAGDAGHITNPTGGLGLTSGLLDVFVLHEALAAVIHGAASQDVLDRYSDDRLRVFREIASPTATHLKNLVYHSTDPDRLETNLSHVRQLARNPEQLFEAQMRAASLRTPSLVKGQF